MSEHALISPSGSYTLMTCRASLALQSLCPNTSSAAADEGTDAHELASLVLENPKESKMNAHTYEGRKLELGHVADENMCDFVNKYIEHVQDYVNSNEGNELFVETRVNFADDLGVAKDLAFGTADAIILNYEQEEIVVVDLKYGRGVEVDADDNTQLMLYALGALREHEWIAVFKNIRLVISQPRISSKPKEHTINVDELLDFADDFSGHVKVAMDLREKVQEHGKDILTLEDFTLGEKQCRFCNAKAICPAQRKNVEEATDADFDDLDQQELAPSEGIDLELLSKFMQKIDLIEGWCKAVRTLTFTELKEGNDVPGYKLVNGREGNRKWKDQVDAEEKMKSQRLKLDEMYKQTIISPTAAEKLLEKKHPRKWNALQKLITRSEPKPSVAPLADKRDAITLGAQEDDFEDLGDDDFDDLF